MFAAAMPRWDFPTVADLVFAYRLDISKKVAVFEEIENARQMFR